MNINESLLHIIAARYISGKDVEININGSKIQLECLSNLLEVSKSLKENIDNKNFNKIVSLLEQKKELTQKFQNLTGITWKL